MSGHLSRHLYDTDETYEFRLFCEAHNIHLSPRARNHIYGNAKRYNLTPVEYFQRRGEFANKRNLRKNLALKLTLESFRIDTDEFHHRKEFFNENLKQMFETYPTDYEALLQYHYPNIKDQ